MERAFRHIDSNSPGYVEALRSLCRQKSISAQNNGIEETAGVVKNLLVGAGADAGILRAGKANPAVYGFFKGESDKTLLFYNHYDVQPVEPLDEWKHPPFGAEIENGLLYARGAADNKGDFLARLFAVKTILETKGSLPVNIKFFVEGEEEIGSPGLDDILKAYPGVVQADACVWEAGRKTSDGRPVIFLGVKGMLYVELSVKCASSDSHSSIATTAPNPAWRLVWALNTLKDEGENIKIDGFYDNIIPLSGKEISAIEKIPDEDSVTMNALGIKSFLLGLSGLERLKRDISYPTCNICGIESGYTGEGSKTVLPSSARAKLDFRMVPGQDPEKINAALRKHLDGAGFSDIKIRVFSAQKAFKTPIDSAIASLAVNTAREAYGVEPVLYPSMAGTGPMHRICGKNNTPCAGFGISNYRSNLHAPDENIKIDDFIQGIKHVCLLINNF